MSTKPDPVGTATLPESAAGSEIARLHARLEKAEAALRAAGLTVESGAAATGRDRIGMDFPDVGVLLDSLLRNAPIGFCFFDREMRYVRINERLAEMNGISAEAHLGRHASEIVPALFETICLVTGRILATGEAVVDYEFSGETPAAPGVTRFWTESYYPVRDDGGEIVGFAVFVEEITERNRSAEALRESEARYRSLFENMLDGFAYCQMLTDEQGQPHDFIYLAVNDAFGKLTGLENVIGMRVTEVIPGISELHPEVLETYGRVASTGNPERFEIDFKPWGQRLAISVYCPMIGYFVAVFDDITVRKRAEQKLQEAEKQFRQTVMNVSTPTLLFAEDGAILLVNQAWTDITGYRIEDIPTISLWTQKAYGDAKGVANDYIDALFDAETRMDDGEWTVTTATGKKRIWHFSSTPMGREPGGRRLIVSTAVDITERKRAALELASRESHLRRVIDNQLGLVGLIDRDGILLEVDKRSLAIAHTRREQVIGKHFADAPWWSYDPEVAGRMRDAMGRALAGEVVRYDVSLFAHGGEGVMIDFMIAPVFGGDGAVEYLIPSGVDIRERYAAEQKGRENEARFRDMADNIAQLAWMANPDGSLFYYNQRWFDYTGTTLEEMQGWGWEKMHHPDHLARMVPAWKAALERGQPWEDTFPLRGKDGQYRWFLSRAFPIRDPDGKIVRWFGTNTDIHEERRAMEELARASRAKDDFLAALSHELRTPLSPVLMAATALASDLSLPAEVRGQLDMMRRNIELEARLIDDLLDLTRISHGKLSITPGPVDIHELLHHTDEIIRSEGLGKKLQVALQLDAARHHAQADPARLQQVFWNLMRNAVKFTPDGGNITVSTHNDTEGGIIISVADSGIGIRAEVLTKIFSAFEQGDASSDHRFGGLGLGLAISNAIVTAHGGEIRAESAGRGLGAKFTVTLGSITAPASTSGNNLPEKQPARALSLLIVEDHESSRMVMDHLLTLSGHRVTTAATVHEALAAYKTAPFDVVISDLGLPDGSGLDLMMQIQNIRPVHAIALSGYGMEDDLRSSREAGFAAHLVKPVNIAQLRQLLNQMPAGAIFPGNS